MASYNLHGGHNPKNKIACGAVGLLDESEQDRIIKNKVISILRANGHTVYDCTEDNGTSQSDVLKKIVAKCNSFLYKKEKTTPKCCLVFLRLCGSNYTSNTCSATPSSNVDTS